MGHTRSISPASSNTCWVCCSGDVVLQHDDQDLLGVLVEEVPHVAELLDHLGGAELAVGVAQVRLDVGALGRDGADSEPEVLQRGQLLRGGVGGGGLGRVRRPEVGAHPALRDVAGIHVQHQRPDPRGELPADRQALLAEVPATFGAGRHGVVRTGERHLVQAPVAEADDTVAARPVGVRGRQCRNGLVPDHGRCRDRGGDGDGDQCGQRRGAHRSGRPRPRRRRAVVDRPHQQAEQGHGSAADQEESGHLGKYGNRVQRLEEERGHRRAAPGPANSSGRARCCMALRRCVPAGRHEPQAGRGRGDRADGDHRAEHGEHLGDPEEGSGEDGDRRCGRSVDVRRLAVAGSGPHDQDTDGQQDACDEQS